MTRLKDKERILKAAREKQVVTHKGAPIRLLSDFSTEAFQTGREWGVKYSRCEKQGPTTKAIVPSKATI